MKCRIAIASVIRDEAPYLLEWIAFHLIQGVQTFRLYDNNSTDITLQLLRALSKAVPIDVISWNTPYSDAGVRENYRLAAAALATRADFVAFIDADEFLFSTESGSLSSTLSKLDAGVGAVAVNQSVFGSNNTLSFLPDLVTARFIRRAPLDHSENCWFKTIVRPDQVAFFDSVHSTRLKWGMTTAADGGAVQIFGEHPGRADRVATSGLRLHHYMLKSRGEFEDKMRRWTMDPSHPSSADYARKYADGYFTGRAPYVDAEVDTALADLAPRIRDVMTLLYKSVLVNSPVASKVRDFYHFPTS